MKSTPLLFKPEMVRAILDGSKTQTRRVVKPQPLVGPDGLMKWRDSFWYEREELLQLLVDQKCPYGQRGDQLWVRETWGEVEAFDGVKSLVYKADGWKDSTGHFKWTPSIHMFRKASRIQLEITSVSVERLQDISEADACAEGCITEEIISGYDNKPIQIPKFIPDESGTGMVCWDDCREWYEDLWESINGAGSWDSNPWVWRIEFRKVES